MYDYVIVGAGSAGCVLAGRLSEDPGTRVLLLEAGPEDRKLEIDMPAAFSKLFKTGFDWAYETSPQRHLENRRLYWPRGKALGGSSSINAMIYSRPGPADHTRWEGSGSPGWSWAEVLPYYKRAERNARGPSALHGGDGPLQVSDPRSTNPLSHAFLEACASLGISRNPDLNGASQEGVGFFQVTQRNGQRHSAAAAYLRPARGRPNLTVLTRAHATRVLMEGTRAIGVAYLRDGQVHEARAEREVLLAGGTVNSPQLLMLSGIGPADNLRRVGIQPLVHLPGVGQNLQDHMCCGVMQACTRPISLASAETVPNLLAYLLLRRGPLTSNVAEAGGFVKTRSDLAVPDLELIFAPTYFMEHGFANPPGHGFVVGAVLQHPESRGAITLSSADPLAPPLIDPNYLASDADVAVLVNGVKLARRIVQAPPFDLYRGPEVLPGLEVDSDDEIASFTRRTAESLYHPSARARWGAIQCRSWIPSFACMASKVCE